MKKTSLIISDKNTSVNLANDVNEICKDLFQHTQIDYFCYGRFYKNSNKTTHLVSHSGWHKHFHKQGLYATAEELQAGVYFARDFLPNSVKHASEYFGRKNFLAIINEFDTYKEVFGFDSQAENIASFYINNLDLLFKFNHFFKAKSVDLFKKADLDPTILPMQEAKNIATTPAKIITSDDIASLKEKLFLRQYVLYFRNKPITLSSRELECLTLLANGRTAKEIANTLNISSRTVETHLLKIKNKIGIYRKSDLINFFEENKLCC